MSSDPGKALARVVSGNFGTFRGEVRVENMTSRPWASATFTGARHCFTLRLQGASARAAATAFVDGLEDREFVLRGHFLADVALADDPRELGEDCVCLSLEALTAEDAC